MAKSLRSGVKKANKSRLRSKVFLPIENARKERLSSKLMDLASAPISAVKDQPLPDEKPSDTKKGIEVTSNRPQETAAASASSRMDIDYTSNDLNSLDGMKKKPHKSFRRKPPRSSIIFPAYRKRKSVGSRRR